MSITTKPRPLVAPKLRKAEARARLQQYIELMDVLRDVQARMKRLDPDVKDFTGLPFSAFHDTSTGWERRMHNVCTLYDEVERLAVAINLQAL